MLQFYDNTELSPADGHTKVDFLGSYSDSEIMCEHLKQREHNKYYITEFFSHT